MHWCWSSHQTCDVAPSILFQWILKVTSCVNNTNIFFNRHLAGLWSVSRSQRCMVFEFLYVVQWSFKCCKSKVWNILQFNLYAKYWNSPFHAFFPDRKWWPRNRKWPFGVDWVPLVIKSLHRKNWGVQMLFLLPMEHWGLYYIYLMFYIMYFPYFTFMK